MNDQSESPEQPDPKSTKLDLAKFLPLKVAVETSRGRLYVRPPRTNDWKKFEGDVRDVGVAAIQQLCSRIEDKKNFEPLGQEDFNNLTDTDIHALVPVIFRLVGGEEISDRDGIDELGSAVKAERLKQLELQEKLHADMRKSIESSYGFLGRGPLENLQEQMAKLVDIRSKSFLSSDALHATMNSSRLASDEIRRALEKSSEYNKALRYASIDDSSSGIRAETMRDLSVLIPTPPENTVLGRATLESAANSRELAQNMDDLVDLVAGLNQTVVKDVLPAWVNQVQTVQQGSKVAFEQAAAGLWWTKWAVITSVLVTVLATWWQVFVTKEIDRENSEQQKRIEELLGKQVEMQRNFAEQQARDAAAMRDAISILKPSVADGVSKK